MNFLVTCHPSGSNHRDSLSCSCPSSPAPTRPWWTPAGALGSHTPGSLWAGMSFVVTHQLPVLVQRRLWGDKQRSLDTFYIMTNTYCKNTAPSQMFGWQSSEELTAPRLPETLVLHLHIRIFLTLLSRRKSENTHIYNTHSRSRAGPCTAGLLYQECLKLVSSFLKSRSTDEYH